MLLKDEELTLKVKCPCGKMFITKDHRQIYCSSLCRLVEGRKRELAKSREKAKSNRYLHNYSSIPYQKSMRNVRKQCYCCTKLFMPNTRSQKFCGNICRDKVHSVYMKRYRIMREILKGDSK